MATRQPLIEVKGFLSLLILHELDRKDMAGDSLAEKIGKRKGGAPLTPGTIYPTLKRLRKLGLVRFKRFGRKKVYTLTPKGEDELKIMYKIIDVMLKGVRPKPRRKKQSKRS
ncbi:MAG: PadR family transcriptional regulator [Candidatus Woesearchaeota archaeon]